MSLAISSSAAPELSLSSLATLCRSRGLEGIELDLVANENLETVLARIQSTDARVVSLRLPAIDEESATVFSKLSARLAIPISTPASAITSRSLSPISRRFRDEGGKLLLEMGTNLDETLSLLATIRLEEAGSSLGIAWELRPSEESLEEAGAVLFACRELLGLVRLHGGGPEQRDQDGRGLGMVLTELALSRYKGPIVLTPSRPELLPKWAKWLTSQKSAGCGTIADRDRVELDMREVEPRDRLETILSAYDGLSRGGMMLLTVDHDPSCMQYTLEAREAAGSFSFRKTEDGPSVWRAEVMKL